MRNVDKCKDELIRMANNHSYVYVSDKIEGCGEDEHFVKFLRSVASSGFIKWLYEDYKFKLSKVEYELLRHLCKKGYLYIVRDGSDFVYAYDHRPYKINTCWITDDFDHTGYINLYKLSTLFQFLKWNDEEPTSIGCILENCEVVDDD